MRTLMLLRHAKSSWKEGGRSDHDRPLNDRGTRDAPVLGRWLRTTRRCPDLIVSSSAKRARRTADAVAKAAGYDGVIEVEPRLYLADPETIVEVVREHGGDVDRLLVVAHNPGLEELAARFTHPREPATMPTACLVEFELDVDDWTAVRSVSPARNVYRWTPRSGSEPGP